jgi:hypothetical protein
MIKLQALSLFPQSIAINSPYTSSCLFSTATEESEVRIMLHESGTRHSSNRNKETTGDPGLTIRERYSGIGSLDD